MINCKGANGVQTRHNLGDNNVRVTVNINFLCHLYSYGVSGYVIFSYEDMRWSHSRIHDLTHFYFNINVLENFILVCYGNSYRCLLAKSKWKPGYLFMNITHRSISVLYALYLALCQIAGFKSLKSLPSRSSQSYVLCSYLYTLNYFDILML